MQATDGEGEHGASNLEVESSQFALAPPNILARDLKTAMTGLAEREAARRLVQYGPNELQRRAGPSWLNDIVRQLVHPLALLLWVAAGLAWLAGTPSLGLAILAVIALNAGLAFVQERQAERAVEALREYLPQQATVVRQAERSRVPARDLVPGDLLIVEEGDRISADASSSTGRSKWTCRRSPVNPSPPFERPCPRPAGRA